MRGWGQKCAYSLTYRNFKISCRFVKNEPVNLRLLFAKKKATIKVGGGGEGGSGPWEKYKTRPSHRDGLERQKGRKISYYIYIYIHVAIILTSEAPIPSKRLFATKNNTV